MRFLAQRLSLPVVTIALVCAAGTSEAAERSFSMFTGIHTFNDWIDVVTVNDVEIVTAGLLGVAGGLEWQSPWPQISFGAEVQLVKHFGDQTNWEVNVPALARYHLEDTWAGVESLAFGIGMSYAHEIPEIEIAREGTSRHEHIYWMIDVSFQMPDPDTVLFTRLHHRSTGFGLLGDGGSTNAIVVGLRDIF